MKLPSVLLFFVMFISAIAAAQPNMPDLGFKTGVLKGVLFEKKGGKSKPIADQAVAIMVFQNGKRVLMLDKKTDTKGVFEFKNIFRDASFKYTIGSMYNDHLYLINDLQMADNQEEMTVDFEVGPDSKHLVPDSVVAQIQEEAPASGSMGMGQGNPAAGRTANHELLGPSKKLAAVLSAVVIAYAFYFALRKQVKD